MKVKQRAISFSAAGLLMASLSASAVGALAAARPQSLKTSEVRTSENDAPEVDSLKPEKITPGSITTVQVSGRNFSARARVCFSNPGILVTGTDFNNSGKLTAHIQVAQDASTGATSLFVVNPDESEAEVPFEVDQGSAVVTESAQTSQSAGTPATTSSSKQSPSTAAAQTFQVIDLGEAIGAFKTQSLPKGTLSLGGGNLSLQEGGNNVFNVSVNQVKEVAPNTLFGISTGTFHIILSSGKMYNFIAGSLSPQDTQSMMTSLQKAVQ